MKIQGMNISPASLACMIVILCGGMLQSAFAYESKRPQQRDLYLQALEYQEKHQWGRAEALMKKLTDYPLYSYLEYGLLARNLRKTEPSEIKAYINKYSGSPLANLLERRYLYALANNKQWKTFLEFYPEEPKTISLRCRHYEAKYEVGEKTEALAAAEKLWLYGRSRPAACDPLFKKFSRSGKLTEDLIWQRMELAYEAKKFPLLTYLHKLLPAKSKKSGQLLLDTYKKPSDILEFDMYAEAPHVNRIIMLGMKSLAKEDLPKAKKAWKHYSKWNSLTNQQRRYIETELIVRAYITRTKSNIAWADKMLMQWLTPNQVEWRVRIALKQLDWPTVSAWILRLPKDLQEKDVWRYWAARATQELGQKELAMPVYHELAKERSFYGFLAADIVNKPYKLNEELVPAVAPKKSLAKSLAFMRIEELLALGFEQKAKAEWMALIDERSHSDIVELAQLALDRHWHYFSVLATIEARAWDLLSMRFPKAEFDNFSHFADERQLKLSFLYAIARQESALNPKAKSRVGASGLMQLMPATAKATAKKIGFAYEDRKQLLDPKVNIRLGSAYIDLLLDQYNGNRLLATAAYNAGPHRVKRWHNKQYRDGVPADVWVETIPFKETRGYVKNVLSFNLIYDHILGQEKKSSLMEPKELKLLY